MNRQSIALLILLVAIAPLAGRASELPPRVADAITLLDLWISEQMAYRGLPGLSIGIVHDQELVWAQGYGFSDPQNRTPAAPETVYRLGSITKLFTATAIMQLRDQGKLRLDDPVARHLPGFKVLSPFPDAPAITIRHLLTHTSGLPREGAFPYWTTHEFPSREEILAALPGQTAIHPPGETYKYSNLGMALLGAVVAAVSGESYPDYVAKHIFEPLGMTSTAAVPSAELLSRISTPFMRRTPDGHRRVHDYYDMGGMAPAGNVVSTVTDLARFAALQFRDDPAGGEQILSGSTLREMHRPQFVYPSWGGGRGLGFAVTHRNGKNVVSHGGWIGGNRAHLLLVPSEKIAVVAMTNADDASPSPFSEQAYEVVGPVLVEAVTPQPPERKADPAWEKYLGVYSDPWGWEYRVLVLDDQLVMYDHDYPPVEDAADAVTRLTPVAEHTFRMSDGELVVFELDDDGKVERIKRRYDYIYPLDPRNP